MSAGYHHFSVAGVPAIDTGVGSAEEASARAKLMGHCHRLAFAVAARWPDQRICTWLPGNARPLGRHNAAEYPADRAGWVFEDAFRSEAEAARKAAREAERTAYQAAHPMPRTRSEQRALERAARVDAEIAALAAAQDAAPAHTPFAALLRAR